MTNRVTFHPIARTDLFALYAYIEEHAGPAMAGGYVDRIETLCSTLSAMPDRGVERDDLGLGVRTVALQRRVLVVYRKKGADEIEILRLIYAGRGFGPGDIPR